MKSLKCLIITGLTILLTLTACGAGETSVQVTPPEIATGTEISPTEADVDNFSLLRTPYVGAAHATHNVVNALPLPGYSWIVSSIEIGADHGDFAESYSPYTLTIFYEPQQGGAITGTRDVPEIPTEANIQNVIFRN